MSLLIDLVSRCLRQMGALLAPRAEHTVVPVRVDGQAASSHRRSGQRGASLVEYALLVALIAIVCVGAVTFFGTELTDSLSTSGDSISN
jgi:Flp pilus assembly pilin Flp